MMYLLFVLIFIISSWVMCKYPKTICWILLFSLPLQRYNIYVEQVHLSVQPILLTLPAAYISIPINKKLKFPDKGFLFAFFLLILGEILSLIPSINRFRTVSVIAFSCMTFSFAYIWVLIIKNKKEIGSVYKALLVVGFTIALLGLYQFVCYKLGRSALLPFENLFGAKTITAESFLFSVGDSSYLRPSSTFVDVNLTAGFLSIVTLFGMSSIVGRLVRGEFTRRLFVDLGLFATVLIAFFLTVSRSGYLGLFVGGSVFALLNYKVFLNKQILGFVALLATLTIFSVIAFDTPMEAMFGRFKDTFFRQDTTGSTQEHQLFSDAAWQIFKEHSVFGIGAGNFEEYYLTRIDTTEDTAYTYNVFLGFLAETGLIGFLTQIGFIIFVMINGFSKLLRVQDLDSRLFLSAAIAAYIGILIANLFYSYYILLFAWLPIGLIISLSNNTYKLQENDGSN